MIVTDVNGCIDTAIHKVNIFMPPLVPSGFSPNGDGSNDFLYVYGGPYKEFEFVVFNKWGERVYQSNDISAGWDGQFKQVDQPVGVFVYTVKVITQDDQEISIKGDVTLIR